MTDLRQGVSDVVHAILDMSESITATDDVMNMRTFDAAQRHLAQAADPARSDRYRRAHLSLAAAVVVALAEQMQTASAQRSTQLLADMGYRP